MSDISTVNTRLSQRQAPPGCNLGRSLAQEALIKRLAPRVAVEVASSILDGGAVPRKRLLRVARLRYKRPSVQSALLGLVLERLHEEGRIPSEVAVI